MSDATPAMKTCSRKTCKQQNPQPLTAFFKDKSRTDGLTNRCRSCQADSHERWRHANPERNRAYKRPGNLWHRYRLRPEQYDAMLESQGGVCARCKQPETFEIRGKVQALAVDHDHACCAGRRSCGQCVRCLLCHHCNLRVRFEEQAQARVPI